MGGKRTLGGRNPDGFGDPSGEFFSFPLFEREHSRTFGVECEELLLFEGRPRREGRNMPMDMGVCILAAEREDINSFNIQDGSDGFRDRIYYRLQSQIVCKREIACCLFEVHLWADKHVAQQRRKSVQERDCKVVFEHNEMSKCRVSGNKTANETGAFAS